MHLHTIASYSITVQYITTITSTKEASNSVCTSLRAVMCSLTALINIWKHTHICKYSYVTIFLMYIHKHTCMHLHTIASYSITVQYITTITPTKEASNSVYTNVRAVMCFLTALINIWKHTHICKYYICNCFLMYIHKHTCMHLHTIASYSITVQYITTITSTKEASNSVCTSLRAVMCSLTALINIWKHTHICKYSYVTIFLMYIHKHTCMHLHTIASYSITVQYITTITSTKEASNSVCTSLRAVMCSLTALINIWKHTHICKYSYVTDFFNVQAHENG